MKNIILLYKVVPDSNKIFFWTILVLTFGKSIFDLIGLGSLIPLIYAFFDQETLINNKYLAFLNLSQYNQLNIILWDIIARLRPGQNMPKRIQKWVEN